MNDMAQRIAPAAIRKEIEVNAPIDRAFAVFAMRMGDWQGAQRREWHDPEGHGHRAARRRPLV